jgi:hypothetical protein
MLRAEGGGDITGMGETLKEQGSNGNGRAEPSVPPTLEQLLAGVAHYPALLERLRSIDSQINLILNNQARTHAPADASKEGWLDAKTAAKYMCISSCTFDKYRYRTEPRLKGFNLDGKTLYKKSDLDMFIMLYAAQSGALS